MRNPLLMLGASMSFAINCSLALPAAAQQELPYFRELLERQQHARQLAPRPKTNLSATKPTVARTTAGACDVGQNGDFESQNTPPTYLNNMGGGFGASGTGATYSPDQLSNWFSPTGGSPDYWAENAGAPGPGGPTSVYPGSDMRPSQAVYGPFTPHSPSGAVGLYYNANSNVAAEYIRTSISPLVSGARYYAEYWVSLSRNANVCTSSIRQNFGLVFGMTGTTSGRPYLAVPAGAKTILTGIDQSAINNGNASDWKRVSQQFDGNGASTMTFGLFSSNTGGNSGDFNQFTGASNDPKTYIFLDDVSLYKVPTAGPPKACSSGSVSIGEGCEIPGAKYAWRVQGQTTVFATTLFTSVNTSGTYELTVTLPDNSTWTTQVVVSGCTPAPTVSGPTVSGPTPTVTTGGPTYLCPGACATYTANSSSVSWSTSPAGYFTTASGSGASFTACVAPGATGQGIITATFYNSTGQPVINQLVQTTPSSNAITFTGLVMHNQIFYMQDPKPVYDGSYMCQGSTLTLDINTTGSTNGAPATWTVYQMTTNQYSLTLSSNGYHAEFVPNVPSYGQPEHPATFEVTLHDACGTAYSRRFTIVSQQGSDPRCPCNDNADAPPCNNGGSGGGGGGGNPGGPIGDEPYDGGRQAYPNPAKQTLHLPLETEQALLLNNMGQPVREAANGAAIDVQNLPAGLYNLRILQKGKVINQHIEVKH